MGCGFGCECVSMFVCVRACVRACVHACLRASACMSLVRRPSATANRSDPKARRISAADRTSLSLRPLLFRSQASVCLLACLLVCLPSPRLPPIAFVRCVWPNSAGWDSQARVCNKCERADGAGGWADADSAIGAPRSTRVPLRSFQYPGTPGPLLVRAGAAHPRCLSWPLPGRCKAWADVAWPCWRRIYR